MEDDEKILLKRTIGKNIRILRLQHSMTIRELAELLKTSPSFLGLVEQGDRGMATRNLQQLCEIFDVSADALLYPIEMKSPEQEPNRIKQNKIRSMIYNLNLGELEYVLSTIILLKRLTEERSKH